MAAARNQRKYPKSRLELNQEGDRATLLLTMAEVTRASKVTHS
jgi:hypothetical protein